MKQDQIIRFAIQCHLVTTANRDGYYMDALTEFAKLVAAKATEEALVETKPNPPLYSGDFVKGVMAERQRIVNLLMMQHEAAKGAHNYWHVAAQLIQADVASDT